jgi:hypothetical protein
LLLAFPSFEPSLVEPWVELDHDLATPEELAHRALEVSAKRRAALAMTGRFQKGSMSSRSGTRLSMTALL